MSWCLGIQRNRGHLTMGAPGRRSVAAAAISAFMGWGHLKAQAEGTNAFMSQAPMNPQRTLMLNGGPRSRRRWCSGSFPLRCCSALSVSLLFMEWHVIPSEGSPRMHQGVDLAAPIGTPVHTTAAGVVSVVGEHGDYGLMVEVRHGLGFHDPVRPPVSGACAAWSGRRQAHGGRGRGQRSG